MSPNTHPKTCSCIAASLICKSLFLVALGLVAITKWSLLARISFTRLVRIDLGPNSTKTRAPAAYIFSISVLKSTEFKICCDKIFFICEVSSGYAFPVEFEYTGMVGLENAIASILFSKGF